MFTFPPDTPWIFAWLGAAAVVGLGLGWLLCRAGRGRLHTEQRSLHQELDTALEARRTAEQALRDSGALAADLQQRLDEASSSLSDADREIVQLRAEIDAAETRIAQLESGPAEGAMGTEEADRLQARLSAAIEEADGLRAALSAATVDSDARVAAAESEAQEALSRAAGLEEAVSAAKVELDLLRSELDSVRAVADDAGEDVGGGHAEERLGEAEQRLVDAEALLAQADARVAETDAKYAEAIARLDELEAHAAGSGEIEARDRLIVELQAELTALTDVEDRLLAKEAQLADATREHEGLLAARDAEVRSLQERLARAEDQGPSPEAAARLADIDARLEAAETRLAEADARAEAAEQEAAGLREAMAEADVQEAEEAARLSEALDAAEQEKASLREALAAAQGEAARLQEALAAEREAAAAPVAAPEPVPTATVLRSGAAAPTGVEERLDMLQDVLADKEARIAYLADRVVRLESNLGSQTHRPAAAPEQAPPNPSPAPAPPAPDAEPDDLTQIWGIGPAIQRKLHGIGITRFEQLAALRPEDQARIGDVLGDFLDRIVADDWAGQARRLVEARGGTIPEEVRLDPIRLSARPDDLTRIKGIGSFIAATLNDLGISTFAQIAAWTPEDVERYGEALVIFQGRITRERWIEQARDLMRGR